jgi:hypothetical protein
MKSNSLRYGTPLWRAAVDARNRQAGVSVAMRASRSLIPLLLCASAACSVAGSGAPRPQRRTCSFFAVAYAWVDSDRDGSPGPDESPLRGVYILLDQFDPGGPYIGALKGLGSTDRSGYTYFRIYLAGCPPTRFELRATTPRGYEPTTPVHVPVTTGDTLRFGFVRRPA